MSKKIRMSIYLIREGFSLEDPDNPVVMQMDAKGNKKLFPWDKGGIPENGALFYSKASLVHASNVNAFFCFPEDRFLETSVVLKVVYVTRVRVGDGERLFAICFGNVKGLLNGDAVEPQFGLKIMLNSIEDKSIRKIVKKSIGYDGKSSIEQSPTNGGIDDFGFDVGTDLMKSLSGKSDDANFGKGMLTGGDAFSLSVDRNVFEMDDFLRYCYEKYRSDAYKGRYDWIDNIEGVKDTRLSKELDSRLVREINEGDGTCVSMAVPDVLDWERVEGFRYSVGRKMSELHDDVDIRDALEVFGEKDGGKGLDDVSRLRAGKVHAISSDNGETLCSWSMYRCVNAELEDAGGSCSYCLCDGKWYKIDDAYRSDIDGEYSGIVAHDGGFIGYESAFKNEGKYNEMLSESLDGSVLLDKFTVSYGHREMIEPCDVLYGKDLIFVKKNAGSSSLSHLFGQIFVACGEWTDPAFVSSLRKKYMKTKGEMPVSIPEDKVDPSEYTVVAAVICGAEDGANRLPEIPFFSRVVACHTAREIRKYGYRDFEMERIPTKKGGGGKKAT